MFPGVDVVSISAPKPSSQYYWPDDPLVAEATARAKPRGT